MCVGMRKYVGLTSWLYTAALPWMNFSSCSPILPLRFHPTEKLCRSPETGPRFEKTLENLRTCRVSESVHTVLYRIWV